MSPNAAHGLPASWAQATIGELIPADGVFIDGDWVESKDQDPDGEIRLIQLADIGDGFFIDKSDRHLTRKKAYELGCTFLKKGDVLVARMPDPLGRCCLFPLTEKERYVTVVDVCIVRVSELELNPKFLAYAINSPGIRKQIADYQSGSTRKRISRGNLGKISLPIAPTPEQDRIVAKVEELLSELDKGIEALTAAREQLKAYRQSVLKHAFEGKLTEKWRKRTMASEQSACMLLDRIKDARDTYYAEQIRQWDTDLREWESGGEIGKRPSKPERPAEVVPVDVENVVGLPALPKSWAYVRLSTLAQIGFGMSVSKDRAVAHPVEVPYLRVANVQRGALDLSHVTKMKVEKSQLSQLELKKWDVLFNEGGDRDKLGRGWVWAGQIAPCITQNHVFRASPYMATELHAKFISYWGNTYGQDYFNTEGKQTTNLASINKTVLSAFPVPLPPIEEQCEIVREVEALLSDSGHLASDIETQLATSIALRQSILKRAFSGQLVPQDPKDEPASALLERIRAERERAEKQKSSKTRNGKSRKKNAA